MVLMAYDQNNCPIYNPAFDTVYVRILPPPQGFPLLDHTLPPNNPTGPDTLVLDVNVNACIPFLLRDTSLLGGQQAHSVMVEDISGGLGFPVATTATVLSPDSLAISVCFTTACNNINKLYRIIARGSLLGECGFEGTAADTVFVLVLAPPNPAPVVNADLSQVPDHLGDTIFVDVHDDACFTFSVQDTFPGISLSQNVIFQSMTGATTGLPPDVTIISSTDSLLVQVCWYPVCSNVDGLFRMILQGTQLNTCSQTALDFDTVYIRVREAINPPPVFVVEPQPGFDLAGDTLLLPQVEGNEGRPVLLGKMHAPIGKHRQQVHPIWPVGLDSDAQAHGKTVVELVAIHRLHTKGNGVMVASSGGQAKIKLRDIDQTG